MIPRQLSLGPPLARHIIAMLSLLSLLGLLGACTLTFQSNAPVIASFDVVAPNSIAAQNGVASLVNQTGGH
jgi:hypothetical protein